MKIKQFFLRLNKENRLEDENKMNDFMQNIVVNSVVPQIVTTEKITYWSVLILYEDKTIIDENLENKVIKTIPVDTSTFSIEERNRYETLRIWRTDKAKLYYVPRFFIASNLVLESIAKLNPSTIEELNNVKGLGEKKIARYGEDIIAVLNSL